MIHLPVLNEYAAETDCGFRHAYVQYFVPGSTVDNFTHSRSFEALPDWRFRDVGQIVLFAKKYCNLTSYDMGPSKLTVFRHYEQ